VQAWFAACQGPEGLLASVEEPQHVRHQEGAEAEDRSPRLQAQVTRARRALTLLVTGSRSTS
jgi:hypothetical protein